MIGELEGRCREHIKQACDNLVFEGTQDAVKERVERAVGDNAQLVLGGLIDSMVRDTMQRLRNEQGGY